MSYIPYAGGTTTDEEEQLPVHLRQLVPKAPQIARGGSIYQWMDRQRKYVTDAKEYYLA